MPSFLFKLLSCLIIPFALFSDHCQAANTRILIIGDGLSAAYQMDTSQGWVHLLQDKLQNNNIQLINAAISGDTTDGGLARLPRLLKAHQPHYVYIELGGNDGLQGHVPKKIAKNLVQMIELSRKHNAIPALQAMQIPTNYGPRYNRMFTETFSQVAEQEHITLFPFFLETIATDPSLMKADGIHPNETAQPLIADFLYPHFLSLTTDAKRQ